MTFCEIEENEDARCGKVTNAIERPRIQRETITTKDKRLFLFYCELETERERQKKGGKNKKNKKERGVKVLTGRTHVRDLTGRTHV